MPSGTAAPTHSPSQPSALPLNSSTDPRDVPDSSAKTLEDPDTSSALGAVDAIMQGTDVSDSSHEAADFAAEAAARAAGARTKAGAADQAGVDGVGYWQVAWLYLTSLLKLGEAYEIAGSHEDAVHAFKEGLELVCHFLLQHVQPFYDIGSRFQLVSSVDPRCNFTCMRSGGSSVGRACCTSSVHNLVMILHGC